MPRVREIATLHFLSGTIAGVRSKLSRASSTATIRSAREQVTMRLDVLAADTCYLCGSAIDEGLARLGSTLCHDCRRGRALRNSA